MVGGTVIRRLADDEYFYRAMNCIRAYSPDPEVIRRAAEHAVSRLTGEINNMLKDGGIGKNICEAYYEKRIAVVVNNLASLKKHYQWSENEIDTTELLNAEKSMGEFFAERDNQFRQEIQDMGLTTKWYDRIRGPLRYTALAAPFALVGTALFSNDPAYIRAATYGGLVSMFGAMILNITLIHKQKVMQSYINAYLNLNLLPHETPK